MAKRFIDTDLFRKPLMRSLQAPYKVLWVYLLCECDHAGVWDVELDVASMRLGTKLDMDKCIAGLGSAVVPIDGGKKWWIPEYIAFQYGSLNPANKVHASAIAILSKYGIDPENIAPCKDHTSPLQGAKDKDKDKDKEKGEGVKGKPEPATIKWPSWAGPNTLAKWEEFKAYKLEEFKDRYASAMSEQRSVNLLAKWFKSGQECVDAIDEAMGRKWQFPVDPAKRTGTSAPSTPPVILNANGKPQQLKPWLT